MGLFGSRENVIEWFSDGVFLVLENGNYLIPCGLYFGKDNGLSFVSEGTLEEVKFFCEIKPSLIKKSMMINKFEIDDLKELHYTPLFEKLKKPIVRYADFGAAYGEGKRWDFNFKVKDVEVEMMFSNQHIKGKLYSMFKDTLDLRRGVKIEGEKGRIFAKPVTIMGKKEIVPYLAPTNYGILTSWKEYFTNVKVVENINDTELIY